MKIHCMVKTQYIAQKTESIDSENIKEIIVQKTLLNSPRMIPLFMVMGRGVGGEN